MLFCRSTPKKRVTNWIQINDNLLSDILIYSNWITKALNYIDHIGLSLGENTSMFVSERKLQGELSATAHQSQIQNLTHSTLAEHKM